MLAFRLQKKSENCVQQGKTLIFYFLCLFLLVTENTDALTSWNSLSRSLSNQPQLTSSRRILTDENQSYERNFMKLYGGHSSSSSLAMTTNSKKNFISEQYRRRVAADPSFLAKSITEVILAAGTQLVAEINRRGVHRMFPEIDFVVAGVLTAIAGKYYSMWKVAPTADAKDNLSNIKQIQGNESPKDKIPTNAFQPFLLDGITRPSLLNRFTAFLVPIPSLFQAGMIASALGYGLTAFLIFLRSSFLPSYVAATVNVNILHACLYTGAFMALVSNVRYQILQGIIEPQIIDRFFSKIPVLKNSLIFIIRLANGLLGSTLAIIGMKYFGLQRLK